MKFDSGQMKSYQNVSLYLSLFIFFSLPTLLLHMVSMVTSFLSETIIKTNNINKKKGNNEFKTLIKQAADKLL